jgi:hypothetical protein
MEEVILADESKMNKLCLELGLDSSTVQKAFKVRRTMYNTKSNSMIELEDWMSNNGRVVSSDSKESDNEVEKNLALSSSLSSSLSDVSPSASSMLSSSSSSSLEGTDDILLKKYENILGQFISMREMEALSWRYGLKQQEEQEEIEVEQHHQQQLQLQQIQTRDYLAEAEDDLFGVGGILNTPTATAAVTNNEANVAIKRTMPSTAATRSATVTASAAAMRSVTSINTSAFDKPQVKVSVKKQQQKQQPSKGGRWGEAMSFSEVGEQMRVSAEYGRRLCSSALKKLTKAVEEGQLDPAMLF